MKESHSLRRVGTISRLVTNVTIIASPLGIDFEHVFENFSENVRVRVKNSFVFELLLFDCQYIIIYLIYSLCFMQILIRHIYYVISMTFSVT